MRGPHLEMAATREPQRAVRYPYILQDDPPFLQHWGCLQKSSVSQGCRGRRVGIHCGSQGICCPLPWTERLVGTGVGRQT